jgi:putative RNA 2'-phosphotransferase
MDTTRASKFLSLILRHEPAAAGVTLDRFGWAEIDSLLRGMDAKGYVLTRADLAAIVESDTKGRYSISDDGVRIRANQEHSITVDLGLAALQPPDVLYHGTATRFKDLIAEQGIQKRSRQHVHLSSDMASAINVGQRHGKVVVIIIDARRMHDDGLEFFQSENGVWLTDAVLPQYFIEWRTPDDQ